jgi:uncharacterized protein (TIGR03437 family)
VTVLVGGLDPIEFDQTIPTNPLPLLQPLGFDSYGGIQLTVTPVTPGKLTISSGNSQTLAPGSNATLAIQVQDSTGTVPVANTTIAWTVLAGAATLSAATSTTNNQGIAQINVTLTAVATGQIQVRAALSSNSTLSQTFTINTLVSLSSFVKVSGDLQSAQAGQNFPAPLIVQAYGSNALPLANVSVGFSSNGGVALSNSSVITDGNGRAQVTATAGNTAGPVIVTALAGGITQTFTLTVIPPGPNITAASFFSTAGFFRLSALAPCSLVTAIGNGIAPNVQNLVLQANQFGPWGTTLATDTVTVASESAPIFSVGTVNGAQQITFQVPCDAAVSASTPVTIGVGGGAATVNMPVVAAAPGIFQTPLPDGTSTAVVVRPDGTFVNEQNPARRGEVVRTYVTGLGPASPAIITGALPVPGSDALVLGQVIVGVNNAGARVVTARVSPNLIGVYEVAFQVPSDAPAGNAVLLNIVVNAPGDSQSRFSQGTTFPVL